jgi:hypothetical protein
MPIATAPPEKVTVPSVAPGLAAIAGAAGCCCEAQLANEPTANKATAAIMKRRIGFPHSFDGTTLVDLVAGTIHNRQPRT